MLKEFQAFIAKGNVLDLAVAVVIGAAFSDIVKSFTTNILTPILTPLTKGVPFASAEFSIGPFGPFGIGSFVNSVIQFLIIAFALFLIVKAYNHLHPKVEEAKVDLAAENVAQNTDIIALLRSIAGQNKM